MAFSTKDVNLFMLANLITLGNTPVHASLEKTGVFDGSTVSFFIIKVASPNPVYGVCFLVTAIEGTGSPPNLIAAARFPKSMLCMATRFLSAAVW